MSDQNNLRSPEGAHRGAVSSVSQGPQGGKHFEPGTAK